LSTWRGRDEFPGRAGIPLGMATLHGGTPSSIVGGSSATPRFVVKADSVLVTLWQHPKPNRNACLLRQVGAPTTPNSTQVLKYGIPPSHSSTGCTGCTGNPYPGRHHCCILCNTQWVRAVYTSSQWAPVLLVPHLSWTPHAQTTAAHPSART
jgi:hypothetical protein